METKKATMWGMTIGSFIGGSLPSLWGDSFFSMTSVLLTAVGGMLGIWIAFKLTHY